MRSAARGSRLSPLSALFRALGDDTRLGIVSLLSSGELCVCHLQSALGVSQPKISRHLAILRAAGVVSSRRSGAWIHYRLAEQPDAGRRRQLKLL
ncbi:MAG TPA: metalloregulator ArsR/SmtB family transcription factor, partial [bacterium]|nr:metalloregulator ArsR/SmtB family transcription factor [bacterium]